MKKLIKIDGEIWEVVSLGVERDGLVFAHLHNTERFMMARNGKHPIGRADFIDAKEIFDSE